HDNIRQEGGDRGPQAVGHLFHRAGHKDRSMTVTATDLFFADRWQREFPLTERPFLDIGFSAGIDEDDVIATFERLLGGDVISRVGAIVRPRTIGSSTLAALSVPSSRMEHVVSVVSEEPLVTH